MQNVLTVQALTAAKQRNNALALQRANPRAIAMVRQHAQSDYTPFGDSRPSFDYVKTGDVIRVSLVWFRATGWFVFDTQPIYNAFRNALGATFNVVAMSPAENWTPGGTITIDLQVRGDFARLNDVVAIVAHDAQTAGLSVDTAHTRGEFVSKVEDTGGAVQSSIPAPGSGNNKVEDFLNNLTTSPISLAVIVGGAVLLFVALKSR